MDKLPYKVSIVLDREFGEQLAALEPDVPVWIVDTPLNTPVVHRLWKERHQDITPFKTSESISGEEILLSELWTIDLHHGSYSHDPPYTILEVVGAPLSERIKAALSEYGFDTFHPGATGFSAVRPTPDRPT